MPNHAPAEKRLANDLGIIVFIQVVALVAVGLGFYLYGNKIVPNYPEWDTIHSLCGVLALAGMIVFVVMAFWAGDKLTNAEFLPIRIRAYGISVLAMMFLAFLLTLVPFDVSFLSLILFGLFPFYCVIPQFFIARRLAKKSQDDIMI